jgi:ssDNA-binding Zn-finger/Zn-ribbon topoisomerase 1
MTSIVERRRITCPVCHVNAYIARFDDGSHVIRCTNRERCSDTCPYLKDPDYKPPFRRAPEYEA